MIVLTVTVRGYNSLVIIIPILTLHISVPYLDESYGTQLSR